MKKTAILFLALAAVISCKSGKDFYGVRSDALPNSVWEQSQWISAADAPVVSGDVHSKKNCRAADGSSWFVGDVENERPVTQAVWMTAGLGVYDIYVNGKIIGEEILKPGFTHYEKTKRSFTYDVTDAIAKGEGKINQFSARLTPGWWADKIVTHGGHEGMVGRKCAFRAVLALTYDDGSRAFFGTDSLSWKAGIAGAVKHAAIFDGETYDARELPGYLTPEKLGTPEINREFNGEILPSEGAEIYLRKDLTLTPVLAYTWSEVEGKSDEAFGKVVRKKEFASGIMIEIVPGDTLVVDFGQNAAAVPYFEFSAAEGTELTCLPGELLNDGNGALSRGMDGPEGSVHRTNLRIPEDGFILKYIFGASKDFVSYYPRCTFFGYRFVSISVSAPVKIRKIASIPLSSITKELENGTLETGDESINKLISNTVWGQRSNYLSVPTDCPQRNERLGWTADTQVFTETGAFFANTRSFFHKWMRDMRDSQSETGSYPGVAPTAQYGGSMMRLGWADAGVIVPWTVWKHFGDTGIISENWESMERYMAHVAETKFDMGVIASECGNYQWADWLSYEPLESCGNGAFVPGVRPKVPLPEALVYWNYLGACYWALDADMMRDMALALAKDEDAAHYAEMADEAREYLEENFLDDGAFKLEILNTMQTPALFALKCGLVEGEDKEEMITRLRENFAAHDNCLQTGFLGTSILMDTLTENGMEDIAYELLFQRKNPSWLYSVDNGATTIWERWNSYTLESGMGPKGMNSFNHYAYGCVCAWIWKTVAGISSDVSDPGFRTIVMKPVPDRRLGYVKAQYNTVYGPVKSSWKFNGDIWEWSFSIPEGTKARVSLPGESEETVYGPGNWHLSKTI